MSYRKLGRTSSHRASLFRNQLASIIEHERIITTLPKAKELRPIIEKMVTLAKEDSVHNRRNAGRQVQSDELVRKLFETISPRFTERPGGYTRIVKLGPRRGDGTEMAILEFVDYELGKTESAKTKEKKAAAPKKASKKAAEGEGTEAAEEKPKAKKQAKSQAKKQAKPAKPKREASPKKPAASKKSAPKKGGVKGAKRGS
ncbi:MAG TPA: 50S ribosomal protein L17 [Thermoanaerobaculia bacterium]|nr:50S ribosomal protein L17 [Thermoanaerobaculia bacterium]